MSVAKCSNEGCHAPDGFCKESATPIYQQCQYFVQENKNIPDVKTKANNYDISWNGLALRPADIELVSQRSTPFMIGLIGSADAGKTSYLAMLYTLLFNGKSFKNWCFAGSYTLREWELQAKTLQIEEGGNANFPQSTPSAPDFHSIYHLALRTEDQLKDVLLSDSSGEVFSKWATDVDDPGAENARWIYEKSDAILFFIDCKKLANEKAKAKGKIIRLARQLQNDLRGRPIVILWSKADKIKEILPNIKEGLDSRLKELFPNAMVLPISNYSKNDPDELCHINNLKASEYLFSQSRESRAFRVQPGPIETDDFFFLYKGNYGSK